MLHRNDAGPRLFLDAGRDDCVLPPFVTQLSTQEKTRETKGDKAEPSQASIHKSHGKQAETNGDKTQSSQFSIQQS